MQRPKIVLRSNAWLDQYKSLSADQATLANLRCMREELVNAIKRLTSPPQQRVLRLRYPLNGESPLGLNEISRLLGWRTERVRAVEVIGLERLQRREGQLERFVE